MEAIDRRFAKTKEGKIVIIRASSFLGGKTKEECDPLVPILTQEMEYVNISKYDIEPISREDISKLYHNQVENEDFRQIMKDYLCFPPINFRKW